MCNTGWALFYVPECSAKSKDKLTDRKQETPRPSAALLMMKYKLHSLMENHRFEKLSKKKKVASSMCSSKSWHGLNIPRAPPVIFIIFIKIQKHFDSNDMLTSSKI